MKVKRTYNLSTDTIAVVKRLVEEDHVAPTQDAVVEQAIAEFARLIRDAADARLWEQAAHDPEFQDEISRSMRSCPPPISRHGTGERAALVALGGCCRQPRTHYRA